MINIKRILIGFLFLPLLSFNITYAEDISGKQEHIKSELTTLQEKKSELEKQLKSAKELVDYLNRQLEQDGQAKVKESLLKEIEKETLRIVPLDVSSVEDADKQAIQLERFQQTNDLKQELALSTLSEEISQILDDSEQKKQIEKDIEALNKDLDTYTKSIDENKHKLDELVSFKFPARGVYTSMYGWRESPFGWGREWHTGIDIAGSGDILSVLDGTVVRAGTVEEYGNYIDIDHGTVDGIQLTTRYAHLSTFYVKIGESVTKGQAIGLMGTTGWSTGVHLHFEVIENGSRVNPKPYLDKAISY